MQLNVLITASEAVPFAKEGGLADVVGALPKYLELRGHNVRVVMPRYYKVDRHRYDLREVPGTLVVPMGIIGDMYCGVLEGRIPGSDVPIYFLEHEDYFGRDRLYDNDNKGYLDNDNRFIFLSKASLEICKMIRFTPDVVHAHDWHTAAVPVLMNTSYRHDFHVGGAASVLTIHNMQHQGTFYEGAMDVLGIGWEHFNFLELEMNDQVNLLKGGIYHANMLNTVSQGYAREIQTPENGWQLEGVVRERSDALWGILNGVDYEEWNPEQDPHLPARYSATDMSGKTACKRELQRAMGLPEREDVPLIGLVTRLVKQKGIDVLAAALPRLLDLDIQIVLLGAGEPWAHFYFGGEAGRRPGRFACRIGYDNDLAHLIEAGSDFFLMPSAFEPCGLNQMYSMRYGTIPIVRATGGLDDSVQNFDESRRSGDGFKFRDLTAGALFDTVGWAVYTWYHDRPGIEMLRRNGMAKRFTWEDAAAKYEALYVEGMRRKLGAERVRRMEEEREPAMRIRLLPEGEEAPSGAGATM